MDNHPPRTTPSSATTAVIDVFTTSIGFPLLTLADHVPFPASLFMTRHGTAGVTFLTAPAVNRLVGAERRL
ncbi:hypothetical protein ACFUTV_40760 [Streptomyces sp. NPDC057298]|uniref:hypothetical protein n=1 Tax=Streptomyces sp. NPDC057298 TaxID=3346091 RepID=UPI0036377B0D